MTIINGYCTLQQIKDRLNPLGVSTQSTDDAVIENMVEQASRAIDLFCGRTFYARTSETRYFDMPYGRELVVDDDLLAITTLTNGDATTITSTYYNLYPYNTLPYYAIRLKESSGLMWASDTNGNREAVITVLGTWGYVDRAGTTARDVRVIRTTEQVCLALVLNAYKKRSGELNGGVATVTAAGVVITPDDIPAAERKLLMSYVRRI